MVSYMGKETTEVVFNRLTVLRAERGLSRQELADALDVHYQTIGYIERNEYNPSLYLALRMAEFFELPIDALFSLHEFQSLAEQVYPSVHTVQPGAAQ